MFEYEEFEIQMREELDQKEIDAIRRYNSFGKKGYNLTEGGQGGIINRKITYEKFCFIYYGCQWQGLTEKVGKYLNIDSSTVSSILREKAHLDFLEKSKKELSQDEIERIKQQFREALNIPVNKLPDASRVPAHISEEEYFYSFCIAASYGRGIEAALARYFNKDKTFLSNGLKSAKVQGKVKRAYDRFLELNDDDVMRIGVEKFNEWRIQSFTKYKLKQEPNLKWRQ